MVTRADTTDLPAPRLPAEENELSRRYLRMIERWVPVGVEYFALWPERPNCGHFFGGCHWYGLETVGPAKTFALASTSPEYDEQATGIPRAELRRMAIQGVRYLCFTHDTGPEKCVRPRVGLGRPENCGTKWGERGKGFFRESQCGTTIAGLALICLLLREYVDEETWMMVARIHADYAERFGDMSPRSGVYWDTQMEENAWTALGLTSVFLFLSRHERAQAWEAMARRWMFSTCATPQDAQDWGRIGDLTVRALTGRTFTTLPDYWAENHGMVHPSYTASALWSLARIGSLLQLCGRELPPELLWNRRRIYENLKVLTDGAGYPQAVQGMDWHYLPPLGNEMPHAVAALFFGDPDAAALERRALRYAELRQAGNAGRLYDRDFALRAHDQQDPMIMREIGIESAADLYLLHRLMGPGPTPTPERLLEERLAGVRVFPHAGFVHHRHGKGQTSFSWRNSIMALPLTREGIYTIAPAAATWLGGPQVEGQPDSHRLKSLRVREYDAGFAVAMVMDRCQETLRQQVLFASLPDGRVLSFERFIALRDVVVEALEQGCLHIINEHFPLLAPNCRGARMLYHPEGATEYRGWLSDTESSDVVDRLGRPAWLNLDDRIGIRFVGTGLAIYHNRHFFKPYRAIADELVLSRQEGKKIVRAGEEVGHLAALLCPEQSHADTPAATLILPSGPDQTACLVTEGALAAANFGAARRQCVFEMPRPKAIPVYPDATIEANKGRLYITTVLEGRSAVLLEASRTLEIEGDVRVSAMMDGACYATNVGPTTARVEVIGGKEAGMTRWIGPGETWAIFGS